MSIGYENLHIVNNWLPLYMYPIASNNWKKSIKQYYMHPIVLVWFSLPQHLLAHLVLPKERCLGNKKGD